MVYTWGSGRATSLGPRHDFYSEPLRQMILQYYISDHLKPSADSSAHSFSEIHNYGDGVGISMNSVLLARSIIGMSRGEIQDITHVYKDLTSPSAWKSVRDLERSVFEGYGGFEGGVCKQDGIIYGLEMDWIHSLAHVTGENCFPYDPSKEYQFYKNKAVGAEARGEFFSLMYWLFGTDSEETLTDLFPSEAIGAGTTSQIADMYIGALLSGENGECKQYRLRTTKIANNLDVGYILMSQAKLHSSVESLLKRGGFDTTEAFNPSIPLSQVLSNFRDAFVGSGLDDVVIRPHELFEYRHDVIYGDISPDCGQKVLYWTTMDGDNLSKMDITYEIPEVWDNG